ncbi:hypothetical protein Trco_003670 [Trichoderma cornu-damae]|uniref:Uncharacterized protein n=1 Tax=Trichoderma cornu-damae TaxID=654480 RepID=A0A9P8TWT0_9HYPO|nr:hypothetical protein Trco_003670 [Trichoderma cornu-damae]
MWTGVSDLMFALLREGWEEDLITSIRSDPVRFDLPVSVVKVHRPGVVRRVAVDAAAVHQVARDVGVLGLEDVGGVAKDPDGLHAHDHVLQRVAVDHPHAGVVHADAPRAPPPRLAGLHVGRVAEEHRGVALDGVRAVEEALGRVGVVDARPAADVAEVAAVGVPGMGLEAAAGRAVEGVGADLLQHDLDDLAEAGGIGLGGRVEAVVGDGGVVVGQARGRVLVERHEVRLGRADLAREAVGAAVVGPRHVVVGPQHVAVDQLLGVDEDAAADLGGRGAVVGEQRLQAVVEEAVDGGPQVDGPAGGRGGGGDAEPGVAEAAQAAAGVAVAQDGVAGHDGRAVARLQLQVEVELAQALELGARLGAQQRAEALAGADLQQRRRAGPRVGAVGLDDAQVRVVLKGERGVRQRRGADVAEAEAARLAGPGKGRGAEALGDALVRLVEQLLNVDDAVAVDGVRRRARVVHDQRPAGRAGLEADVRVVKVGAGRARVRLELVVEVVLRRDRPLARHGGAVREGRRRLGESVPSSYHGEVGILHAVVHSDPHNLSFRDMELGTRQRVVDQRRVPPDASDAYFSPRHPEHSVGNKRLVVDPRGMSRSRWDEDAQE